MANDNETTEDLTVEGLLAILDAEDKPGTQLGITYQRSGMLHKLDATVTRTDSVEGFVEAWRHLGPARQRAVVEQLGEEFEAVADRIADAARGVEV